MDRPACREVGKNFSRGGSRNAEEKFSAKFFCHEKRDQSPGSPEFLNANGANGANGTREF
jgi:hypothetical protein